MIIHIQALCYKEHSPIYTLIFTKLLTENTIKDTDETAQNFLNLYQAHQSWSEATFGTEKGPTGPFRHLIDEADYER